MTDSRDLHPAYVVDTSALIWYLTDHPKLSKIARTLFEAAERGETRLLVSAITLAEMFYADKKFDLFVDFAALYADLQAHPGYEFVPFYPDDVLDFERDEAVPTMHDRMIAGLARRLSVPLIASDPEIVSADLVETIW